MRWSLMTDSVFMRSRFKEITPEEHLENLDVTEVEKACHIAFEIIGYTPRDFNKAFTTAWTSSGAVELWEFIYDVWEADK